MGGDNITVIAAGLPNITGKTAIYDTSINNLRSSLIGAFYPTYQTGSLGLSCVGWQSGNFYRESLDASRSSDVYGNSETVQPPAFALVPQIKY